MVAPHRVTIVVVGQPEVSISQPRMYLDMVCSAPLEEMVSVLVTVGQVEESPYM